MKQELYKLADSIMHKISNCEYEIKRLNILKTADEISILGKGNEEFRRYNTRLEFYNLSNINNMRTKLFIEFIDKLIEIETENLVNRQKEFDEL